MFLLLGKLHTAQHVFLEGISPKVTEIPVETRITAKLTGDCANLIDELNRKMIHLSGVSIVEKGKYSMICVVWVFFLKMTELFVKTIVTVQNLLANKLLSIIIGSASDMISISQVLANQIPLAISQMMCFLVSH